MPTKVLIADDNSTIRDLIKHTLSARPDLEICGEAADGLETVEKARLLRPDLILLDFSMPKMNGAEASSVIKKRFPNIAIILFTMYGESVGKSMQAATGVDAVLSKPDGLSDLLGAIDAVLAGKKPSKPPLFGPTAEVIKSFLTRRRLTTV